ncbi:interferon alpha-inducible protein 27-like protein 2B isoform X2 [Dreissena polymorpha]|uniref:interferon alpha-inducible protein 27-like protein 2B isoform X2 n=1 Tax=Dreissena polymorpha TaxID=45954 RepID=UPI002263BBE5|nr:interferon alpha-inducible protein 27-like protein 2B isoform X2 [Dreissena polymorpha]
MDLKMLCVVVLFVLVSFSPCDTLENLVSFEIKTSIDCPADGQSGNGYWNVNNKAEVPRCVLKCYEGFEPDRCHVLRRIKPETWNRDIPHCVKKSWIPWGTMAKAGVAVAAGAGAVAAAPVVLSAVGFTSAGVAAGSIAAGLQGPAVASGSLFALLQSAGAAGLTTGTQAGVFSWVTAVTGAVSTFFGGEACEAG